MHDAWTNLPVGPDLDGWAPPDAIAATPLVGRFVTVEPVDPAVHAPPLYDEMVGADALWTYLPWGPMADNDEMAEAIQAVNERPDWQTYALLTPAPTGQRATGMASYLRIDPRNGSIEIGGLLFTPAIQRTPATTEAIALMITHAFESGYRRVEWKCDDLNAPSRAAAERLGFTYEGTFRKHTHYKGRSRDTAWFAILDDDWPMIRSAFDAWLAPTNFDEDGMQRQSLTTLRETTC